MSDLRHVHLERGRERVHPTGAAAAFAIIALIGGSVGFAAGWIVGALL